MASGFCHDGALLMSSQIKGLTILNETPAAGFRATLEQHKLGKLARASVATLQINVGKLCNQACNHCHVEAGPRRTEIMPSNVADRILTLLSATPSVEIVDLTGGAPELNPNFRRLVVESRRMKKHVIDRCNLTVLFESGQEDLPAFLSANQVEIAASLPCYTSENVEKQRGKGVFEKSIRALQSLNELGYGRVGSTLILNLVYNPVGASLPPPQEKLEADYRNQLGKLGIEFNRLFTITNMPIKRFSEWLIRGNQEEAYMGLLVSHFNPATVERLMCRSLISVGWNGRIYDCDFNQMLEIEVPEKKTIWEIESFDCFAMREIATAGHCFGCTAGAGSSCGGSLQ